MASVWFLLVAITVGHVCAKTGRNCADKAIESSCDECIRCGGAWCHNPDSGVRCSFESNDDCSEIERLDESSSRAFDDQYLFTRVKQTESVELKELYHKPQMTLLNSSIEGVTRLEEIIEAYFYESGLTSAHVTPFTDFCPARSLGEEYATVMIQDTEGNDKKEKTITVVVPCQCPCSKSTFEEKSERCSGRGNYSCGICACEKGWEGPACEKKVEEKIIVTTSGYGIKGGDGRKIVTTSWYGIKGGDGRKGGNGNDNGNDRDEENRGTGDEGSRGDISECENLYGKTCSNNGVCKDGKCVCNMTLEGSHYFNEQCMSICLSISSYADNCLSNPPIQGECEHNSNIKVNIDTLNRTRLAETNDNGKRIWVNCTETTDSCTIIYTAMRDSNNVAHVMFFEHCNAIVPIAEASTLKVTVPVVLGVIAVLATAAAVAGFMVWKNRDPPLPLSDPGYDKIDAEDCTGMNPLYKPPTSSFKNPTYGKW